MSSIDRRGFSVGDAVPTVPGDDLGILTKTDTHGTLQARTITGTANQITVTNPDGVAGNPTISVPTNPQFPFLQTGTGAVSRSLSAKVGEIISVKDFGAACDNSTDDTAAIQAAINAAAVVGSGALYIPGVCKISSTLNIASGFITIFGGGRLVSGIRTTSATASIFNITASYTTIDSMSLTGTAGTIATAGSAINANGAQGCKFTNLYISDVYTGITLNNCTASLVQFVKLLNIYGPTGVSSLNGGGDYIVCNQFDPVFYVTYNPASGFGAWAQSTAYTVNQVRSANGGYFVCSHAGTSSASGTGPAISAFNTEITDGTAKWYFICATNSKGVSLTSASNSGFVAFNDISGPWSCAIYIDSSDGNSIVENTMGQVIGNGIQLNTSATNNLIHGNVISGMYGANAVGIEDATAGTATGNKISSNYISGAGWYGIYIQSANTIVTGNTVTGAGAITGAYGIEVAANVNDFTISNNAIIASSGMTGPIKVGVGTSDYYHIVGNVTDSGAVSDGGTGTHKVVLTGSTGSGGSVVMSNSPTIATPAISSPNITGHPLIEGVTSTGATGTGKLVFNDSPTLTGAPIAPTAAVDTNTTQIATTAMVLAQAASTTPLIGGTAAVGTSTRYARADHVHPQPSLAPIKNSLSGAVTMTTQGTYYDGPSVAQGSTGTWFASGNVLIIPNAGGNIITCKLWDGTTVISSGLYVVGSTSGQTMSLSGYLASPAGNLRISCANASANGGSIAASDGIDGNTASTISAIRVA